MGKTHVTPTMPATPPLMSLAGRLKRSTTKKLMRIYGKSDCSIYANTKSLISAEQEKQWIRKEVRNYLIWGWDMISKRRRKLSGDDFSEKSEERKCSQRWEDHTCTVTQQREISQIRAENRLNRYGAGSRDQDAEGLRVWGEEEEKPHIPE